MAVCDVWPGARSSPPPAYCKLHRQVIERIANEMALLDLPRETYAKGGIPLWSPIHRLPIMA
jgi:hypothetical protein